MDNTLKIYIDKDCSIELDSENGQYRLYNIIPWIDGYTHKAKLYVKNTSIYDVSLSIETEYLSADISISSQTLAPGESCEIDIFKDVYIGDVTINVIDFSIISEFLSERIKTDVILIIKKVTAGINYNAINIVKENLASKIRVRR